MAVQGSRELAGLLYEEYKAAQSIYDEGFQSGKDPDDPAMIRLSGQLTALQRACDIVEKGTRAV